MRFLKGLAVGLAARRARRLRWRRRIGIAFRQSGTSGPHHGIVGPLGQPRR